MRLFETDCDGLALLERPYRQRVVAVVVEVLLFGLVAVLGDVARAVWLDQRAGYFLADVEDVDVALFLLRIQNFTFHTFQFIHS